jgi:hypothetical protein
MVNVMNTPYRKIFNVSDWSYFAYVSAETGQVQSYIPELDDNLCGTTAPNSPCDAKPRVAPVSSSSASSSSASSSAASSVTSTPEKKKMKSRKQLKRQQQQEEEETADDWMIAATLETSSVVTQLRKKVSKLDLTDRTL